MDRTAIHFLQVWDGLETRVDLLGCSLCAPPPDHAKCDEGGKDERPEDAPDLLLT